MTNLTFFSSPIGLGHATRDVAIAQHLDNTRIKFVSGEVGPDRKSTRLNSSHIQKSRMPSSA